MRRLRLLQILAVTALALASRPDSTRADATTGTWTGEVQAFGNYYLETSTRVIMPDFQLDLESPDGVRVGTGYLLDVITSASIAQTGSDVDELHNEYRHAVRVSAGHEFDVAGVPLDISGFATYSTEPDYKSWIFGASAVLSMDERNSVLTLRMASTLDTILKNNDASFEEHLWGLSVRTGFDQVLNRRMLFSLAYQYDHLDGFLANGYRSALRGPLPYPEQHPESRNRHTVEGKLAIYFPRPHSALHLMYAAYLDDWDIGAIAPEVRWFPHIGKYFVSRLRYRFYTQTQSYFCCNGDYARDYTGPITNDPKMTEFRTQMLGARIELGMGMLEDTVFDFARDAWLEATFDRMWNTNAYGNAWIAQFGGRLPF